MNRYEIYKSKPPIVYLEAGSVWELIDKSKVSNPIATPDWNLHIIIRETRPNEEYIVAPVSHIKPEDINDPSIHGHQLAAYQRLNYHIIRDQCWGYAWLYGAIKKKRTKQYILDNYRQIDKVDYLFGGTPFSQDTDTLGNYVPL